jgi:flagellin-like protein
MRNLKSFRRNLKGISPIFATLILISIVVIASGVVYTFTSGTFSKMTGTGTGASERVSILAASITVNGAGTGAVSVYAESKNGVSVSVSNILIKDANGKVVTTVNLSTTSPYSKSLPSTGDLIQIGSGHLTLTGMTKGNAYSLTVISTSGSSFTSSIVVAH